MLIRRAFHAEAAGARGRGFKPCPLLQNQLDGRRVGVGVPTLRPEPLAPVPLLHHAQPHSLRPLLSGQCQWTPGSPRPPPRESIAPRTIGYLNCAPSMINSGGISTLFFPRAEEGQFADCSELSLKRSHSAGGKLSI